MPLPKRLLALEIRASRLGFAVLETPTRLLDWGVRSFGEQSGKLISAVSDRIVTLLAFHKPSAVVLRIRKYHSAVQNKKFLAIVSAIRTETGRNSVRFRTVSTKQVRDHFASSGHATKHGIATNLARRYEELSWRLPPPRKPYQSEAAAMLVFDALATGVAFVERQSPSTLDI